MDNDAQIAAIKSGLAALDSAIAQAQGALRTASNPDDIRSLTSTLVDLRSEQSRLQTQLDALESANVEVADAGSPAAPAFAPRTQVAVVSNAQVKAVHKRLASAMTDRSVVAATLDFANGVRDDAKQLRLMGATRRMQAAS